MAYQVLNLLSDGGVGGIENLCKCISDIRTEENCFCCLFEEGAIYEEMKKMEMLFLWFPVEVKK